MKNTRFSGGGQFITHLSFIITMTIYLFALTDGYVGGVRLAFAESITDINTNSLNVGSLAQPMTINGSYYINSSEPNISSSSITNRTGRSGLFSSSNGANLLPYHPDYWSDKIVISNTKGTTINSSVFYTTDILYVDVAIQNNGTASVSTPFYVSLYLDGVKQGSIYFEKGLSTIQSNYGAGEDFPIGSLTAGTHSIKIKVDSTEVVSETDESDNEYTKTITVQSNGKEQYNLLPYKPDSWSDKIVVANTKGTTTDSSILYDTDTLYVDSAYQNMGTASLSTTFMISIYVDGVSKHIFSALGLPESQSGWYGYGEDRLIGSLTAGTHTIKIKVDSTEVVAETDESDNEYTKTITVKSSGNPTLSVTPASVNASKDTGTKNFNVSNYGAGSMSWIASVTSGSSWLKITSGSSGTNTGTIKCSFDANTTTSARTGKITVKVTGAATGSPKDVTVIQAAGGSKPTVTTSAASSITATTATFEGTVNPNGLSTSYYFEYGNTKDYGSKTASADAGSGVAKKSVSAIIDGLTENIAYHFRIVATNSAGTTSSSDNTFTTMSSGLEPPVGITEINKTSNPLEAPVYMGNAVTGGSQMELSVNFPAYNQPVDIWILIALPDGRFYVVDESNQLLNLDSSGFVPIAAELSGKETAETILEPFEVGSAGSAFDPWPKDGTWNVYWLIAPADSSVDIIKAIENGDYEFGYYSFSIVSPVEAINPPSNLTAQAISQSQINITWQDNSSNETGFNVFRKTGKSSPYTKISTVSVNVSTYKDSGLSPNTTYYYKVTSFNATSESDYSNEASTITPPESTSDVGYAGVWNGTADFGTFTLTVNEDSRGITKFSRTFLSYKCGNATTSGSISISSSNGNTIGSIINSKFTLTSEDGSDPITMTKSIFTFSGSFTSKTTASGTFTKTNNGIICSGVWVASK